MFKTTTFLIFCCIFILSCGGPFNEKEQMEKAEKIETGIYKRIELYDEVLQHNPSNSEAWSKKGMVLQMLGGADSNQYSGALNCLDSALKYKNDPEYYCNKAFIYLNMEDKTSALKWFKIADSLGSTVARNKIEELSR
ncbi:MAG: hypothetical protein IAF38_03275 [Bacteroidia bacterium]|nr:hypothetical protein [Bacteroidia bacterium]